MEMLRSLSTRTISRRNGVYNRVGHEESTFSLLGTKLMKRSTSVPYYAPSIKLGGRGGGPVILEELPRHKPKKTVAVAGKLSHPIFSLFYGRNKKKKATAKPEFSRYVEYLKEGGMWDSSSNTPIIYFN
ncbi:unnamed protein product [Cochlearia groenlandica]